MIAVLTLSVEIRTAHMNVSVPKVSCSLSFLAVGVRGDVIVWSIPLSLTIGWLWQEQQTTAHKKAKL